MNRLLRRPASNPLPYQGRLTLSAGVITDTVRAAGIEGDGATYPASRVGVWPAATNLITNGGFETNTTGWVANNSCTLSRDTTQAKFGSACLKLVTGNAGTQEGATLTNSITVTNGATYTASVWVWGSGTIRVRLTDVTVSNAESSDIVLSSTPQRVTVTYTMQATTAKILIKTTTQQSVTYYVDGVQLETGSIATPYIETDGGAASRVAGRITLPVSGIFTATQGWFIARVKTGFAAAGPGYVPRLMSYGDATDDYIAIAYEAGNWKMVSDATGGAAGVAASIADAGLVVGDSRTIYGGWVSDRVNVALGTTAWGAGTARSEIPTVASTVIDIGSLTAVFAAREAACTFDWVVMGDGLYTAVDPSVAGNWGDNDPLPYMLPRAAQPTALWAANGDGTLYRYAP